MTTVFDFVTVASFFCLVGIYFFWSRQDQRLLLHFAIAGLLIAVANQAGNAGKMVLAIVLIVAAFAYALIMTKRAA